MSFGFGVTLSPKPSEILGFESLRLRIGKFCLQISRLGLPVKRFQEGMRPPGIALGAMGYTGYLQKFGVPFWGSP